MVKALVVFLTLRSKLFISTSTDMVLNVSRWPFKMFTVTRRSSLKPVFAYYVEASSSKAVALILRSSFLKTTRTFERQENCLPTLCCGSHKWSPYLFVTCSRGSLVSKFRVLSALGKLWAALSQSNFIWAFFSDLSSLLLVLYVVICCKGGISFSSSLSKSIAFVFLIIRVWGKYVLMDLNHVTWT